MQRLGRYLVYFAMVCAAPVLHAQQRPSVDAEQAEHYLLTLKTGASCERRTAIMALHKMGKDAIPLLIDRIGDREVAKSSTLMLANPALSYAPPGSQRDAFSGVLYAYVIELILGRESLKVPTTDHCMFLLGLNDYAYGHGLIMKGQNVIGASELERVKKVYSEWWEVHRNESLPTLRVEWQKSLRPLTGSPYKWF